MATQTTEKLDMDDDLMVEIRQLAQTAVNHHLSIQMLGDRPLTRASALMVLQRLRSKQPADIAPRKIEFASPAIQATPEIERDPSWPRWLHVPEGIYFYEGSVYRVYKSKYPPNYWMCKLLDVEAVQSGGSRWTSVRGVVAKLRPEHAMSAEQSLQFEAMYGITVCTVCGAELENEESKARRKGPVCANK
jgi:hypothetical protein